MLKAIKGASLIELIELALYFLTIVFWALVIPSGIFERIGSIIGIVTWVAIYNLFRNWNLRKELKRVEKENYELRDKLRWAKVGSFKE